MAGALATGTTEPPLLDVPLLATLASGPLPLPLAVPVPPPLPEDFHDFSGELSYSLNQNRFN